MKKITFTKACKVDPKYPKRLSRPNYPGYLLLHSNHPGREFVIARGSNTTNYDGSEWRLTSTWMLYERKSSINLNPKGNRKTREKRVDTAIEYLALISLESMQKLIETALAKRLGAIMLL